jgi:hypothetical protein
MVIRIKFNKREAEIGYGAKDVETEVNALRKENRVEDAKSVLKQRNEEIENAIELAEDEIKDIEQGLESGKIRFRADEFTNKLEELKKDKATLLNILNSVYKMRNYVGTRDIGHKILGGATKVPESGGYAKKVTIVKICDNPDCPGGNETIRLSANATECPFCHKKLKLIGEKA